MKKYYFLGIKGTGMASLAIILKQLGHEVIGSDISDYVFTEINLKMHGIEILTFNEKNITEDFPYTIIYSTAFNENNPEFKKARELGLKMMSYNEALGKLIKNYRSIAVAGTHGKTTTATMLSNVFGKTVGTSYLIGDGNGFCNKDSEYFVFEACEYKRHFLAYHPTHAIITNVDFDHVDYYKDLDDVKSAFIEFINQTKEKVVIYGKDNPIKKPNDKIITYGFEDTNDVYAKDIVKTSSGVEFTYCTKDNIEYRFSLPIYGEHNLLYALAVITVCLLEGISLEDIEAQFKTYTGPKRRFEIIETENNIVIDDYAHHPIEIRGLFEMTKQKYPDKELVAVFEPHTYSRTERFLNEYAKVLDLFDYLHICPIYGSPREPKGNITTEEILAKIPKAEYLTMDTISKLAKYKDKVILFFGCAAAPYTKKYLEEVANKKDH